MFHFLRPEWLWGLPFLFGLLLLIAKKGTTAQPWESVCDAHLLPHLLVGTEGAKRRLPLVLLGGGWTLAILALAGPVWSQLPQPVVRTESALVLVLDLSRSMDVQDVAPSRLTRAKHKILDMLQVRKEGLTALVVFAGEPFVVSPLTDDAKTMVTLVQSLETELMPLQGSRPDFALRKGDELLWHVGHAGGEVLLVTDGEGDPATLQVVEELHRQGRRVSVLGVGTPEGAPIPEPGGFLKDSDGSIAIPKLNMSSLQAIANAGGGRYATVTLNDEDILRVLPSSGSPGAASFATSGQRTTDLWQEEGPWLVLLLLVFALPAFRQGWLGMFLAFMLIPQVSEAFSWESLWFRPDQQGARALERKAPAEAAALFQDPEWKGIAQYRAGNYQEAEKAFSTVETPDGHYNRGNALAKVGRYEEALASYQTALAQQPHHADARHNMEVIQELLKKGSSSKQEGQSFQSTDAASSKQENKGEASQGEGGESAKAADSTDDLFDSEMSGSQKEQPDKSARKPGSPSDASVNDNDSEKTPKDSSTTRAGERHEPEASRTDQLPSSQIPSTDMEENPGDQRQPSKVASAADTEQASGKQKSEQALQQWLRRIPDDPGGLLRRKFLLEHQRRTETGRPVSPQGRRW